MPRTQRRAQLLAIGEDLFASRGYHHISMDDIAGRAGVGKPVLYRHFPSKLDLYLTVVDEQGDHLVRAVHATLDPYRAPGHGSAAGEADALAHDGLAVVEGVVRAYVTYARTAGRSSALLFEPDVLHDPAVRARVLEHDAQISRALADVLVRLTGLEGAEALVVARTCTAVGRAAAAEAVHPDGAATAEDVARLVPRLVWSGVHGLLRRPGASPADGTDGAGRAASAAGDETAAPGDAATDTADERVGGTTAGTGI
jgi:AcrR family transcriptional regulator